MPAPHATTTDLLGDDTSDGFLSAEAATVASGWTDTEWSRILDRASELVDDLTGRANYDVDENGNAVDENLAAALRMAVCAVIELWIEVGEDNDVDGLAGDRVNVTGFSGSRAPEASRRVLRPLRRAGLLAQPGEGQR